MECGGNDVVNTIFEENLLNQSEKQSEDADTSARQKFIQAKYKCRKYCAMSSRGLRPSALPNENPRGASGSGSMTNHSAVASRTIVQRLDKKHARRSETSDRSSDGAARNTSRSGAASQHTAVMPADVVMENSLVSPYFSQSSQALAETAMDTSQSTPGNMEIFVLLCMREASQGHSGKLTFQGRPDFFDLANRAVEVFRRSDIVLRVLTLLGSNFKRMMTKSLQPSWNQQRALIPAYMAATITRVLFLSGPSGQRQV
jgi:hypothetical protein